MSSAGGASGGMMPKGPPYLSSAAGLGGLPTNVPDIPILAVFLLLFVLTAATHMTILQINLRRGHKFIISGLLFGFCMARIVTCIMRIVWTTHSKNIRVAIAAQIFVAAGVVLLFVVNLLFTFRIVRAWHPTIGWHKATSAVVYGLIALVVITIIMVITVVVQSFYTLNANTHRIDRDIQLYGQAYFMFVAFLPIPILLGGVLIPRKNRLDRFGTGRFRTKIIIVLIAAAILTAGAAFRFGIALEPRPLQHPAWYHSKACFYVFNFTFDWLTVVFYAIMRVDMRFYIPDGAHGSYGGRKSVATDVEGERIREAENKEEAEGEY